MMKKLYESLNAISIMSWVITIMLIAGVLFLEANNFSFKMAWNDVARSYTSESILTVVTRPILGLIVCSGLANLLSTFIRSIYEKRDSIEMIEEEEA